MVDALSPHQFQTLMASLKQILENALKFLFAVDPICRSVGKAAVGIQLNSGNSMYEQML